MTKNCHPERSEGPILLYCSRKQVLRFAQDDSFVNEEVDLIARSRFRLNCPMPPQQLWQVLRERRSWQHHIATNLVRLLLQVSLHMRQEADDRRSFLQLALQLGDQGQRLGVGVVQVKNDERRLSVAIVAEPVSEVFFVLHEFDLHVHFPSSFLNLGDEEQILDERKDARGSVFMLGGQGLRFHRSIGRTEAGSTSSTPAAIVAAHICPIVMVHGSGIDSLSLFAVRGHPGSGAWFARTPSSPPFLFP